MNTLRTLQIYMKNQNGKKMSRFFFIVFGTYSSLERNAKKTLLFEENAKLPDRK